MFTKAKMLGLTLATAAVLAWPILVWADNAPAVPTTHEDGDWHHGRHDQMLSKILDLSEDQEKQLKDSKEKQKTAMKSIFEQMKTNREAFDAEIIKATPDMGKINDIQTKIKDLQSQMVDNFLNSTLDIKKILTPEQFAGYMALEKERKLMMHDGHGQFGHKDGWGKDGHKHGGDKDDEGDRD